MDLIRDLLDARVVDRNGREIGRVDAIVVNMSRDRAPYVTALEVGPSVLARRLGVAIGRVVEGLEHAFGVDQGRPFRIPIESVIGIGETVKVDVSFGDTPAATIEHRLRRWVRRIPFAS